jgi:hypothetical protein
MKWLCTLLLIIGISIQGIAQNITKIKFDRNISGFKTTSDSLYPVKINVPVTGLVIAISRTDNFKGSFLVVESDTTFLYEDEDKEGEFKMKFSNLITFSTQVDSLLLYPAGIKNELTIFLIDSKKQEAEKTKATAKKKVQIVPSPK